MPKRSLWQSFGDACRGVVYMVRVERNARIEFVAAILVVCLGLSLDLSRDEWALLTLTIGTVLATEAFNTAVESFVDLLSPEYHERAKVAKDTAAGAVLLSVVVSVILGFLILGPPLYARLFA